MERARLKIAAGVLDGNTVARGLRRKIVAEVAAMSSRIGRPPGLAVVLVGDSSASNLYVEMKTKACAEVGIKVRTLRLSASISEAEILKVVQGLNCEGEIDGILVQLPLPSVIKEDRILCAVAPSKDVDGFHPENVGRLWLDLEALAPATPSGIIYLLEQYGVLLNGARAVVVGRSNIVGKPMAALLLRKGATVTVCHSQTRDLASICCHADILVAALGRPGFIEPNFVKEGAIVIDVGVNRIEDRGLAEKLFAGDVARLARFEKRGFAVVGDVDFEHVRRNVKGITPVPGGVGPLTVAMLLRNTMVACRRRTVGEGSN